MHIPDSMLSPSTSAVMAAAMAPVWVGSARAMRKKLSTREVPLLALGAAFCFTVMMFNIPALGGTTAHPVAGTLLAVMLGPWAAVIGITAALTIQAIFFGDGGILALGANCFTMAFALPFVGCAVYLALFRITGRDERLRALCAGVGAYAGIVAASGLVAILLGIQPALFHEANGHALYFPFGLNVTLPAMLAVHLIVAGPAEAAVTAAAVAYLLRANVPLYGVSTSTQLQRTPHRERIWLGLGVLLALTPVGLLARGEAWGEWDAQGVRARIAAREGAGMAYVPVGLAASEEHAYKGLPGYADYGSERGGKAYIIAGLIGAVAIIGTLFAFGYAVSKRRKEDVPGQPSDTSPSIRHRPPSENTTLPAWMREEPVTAIGTAQKSGNRYLERTVADLTGRTNRALQSGIGAGNSGLLQRFDPRARVIATLLLIAPVTVCRHLTPLLLVCALTAVTAALSGVKMGAFFLRIWLAVPVFVGGIVFPAAFSSVTPGRELLVLLKQPHLAISAPGLALASLLIVRTGTVVSLGGLLAVSTRAADILDALRRLGLPEVFTMMLAMTHRYTLVLLSTSSEMFEARTSRRVGYSTNVSGRRSVGAGAGSLFSKTLALSDEVHGAMISRGFRGSFPPLHPSSWSKRDTAALLACMMIAAVVVWLDHHTGLPL